MSLNSGWRVVCKRLRGVGGVVLGTQQRMSPGPCELGKHVSGQCLCPQGCV